MIGVWGLRPQPPEALKTPPEALKRPPEALFRQYFERKTPDRLNVDTA
jgi:hypothetical protein